MISIDSKFVIIMVIFLSALIFSASGLAQSNLNNPEISQKEDYDYVSENWNYSMKINFSEYWKGDNKWGGSHRTYPIEIDTEKLIENNKMRGDCLDIRVASKGELVGSRVVEGTCGGETKVYFTNAMKDSGEVSPKMVKMNSSSSGKMKFDVNEDIEELEVFYGNMDAGLGHYTASVYNDGLATLVKPESTLGMYYGHHTYASVSSGPSVSNNDKQTPKIEFNIDFNSDDGGADGVDRATIQDSDGNSATRSASRDWTMRSGDVPNFVSQGEQISVRFRSPRHLYGGHTYSGWVNTQWGADPNDPTIQNPTYSTSGASGTSSSASVTGTVDVNLDNSVVNDNEITSCSVTAYGQDGGGSSSISTTITDDGNGDSQGTCQFTAQNDDNSNWQPGEELEFDISVDDNYGGSDSYYASNAYSKDFPNSAPESVSASVDGVQVFAEGVWGGESGVQLNFDVTDYESATTNTDLSVEFYGDNGQVGSTQTVSNGQGTVSVNWERNNQPHMFGFDRGDTYNWNAEAEDVESERSSDNANMMILREATVRDPQPVMGDSANYLNISVGDNPSVRHDADLNQEFDVQFWVKDGPVYELEGVDTISGPRGNASLNIENMDIDNPPAKWKFAINDTYSYTDYANAPYDGNTDPNASYDFITAEPPRMYPDDPASYPVDATGVGLNPDLNLLINDPDGSDSNVTFYQGDPGTNKLGEVTVPGGGGVATLDSSQHSLGSTTGETFEWSVEVEDIEFNRVNQSGKFSVQTVRNPQISFQQPNAGASNVNISTNLNSRVNQLDGEGLQVKYTVTGGGQTFTHQEAALNTASGQDISQMFNLEEGTSYNWMINASFNDEYGNTVFATDSSSFTVADAPEVQGFNPDEFDTVFPNPVIDVSFDNGGSPATVEFVDSDRNEVLNTSTGVVGSASYNTSDSNLFGGQSGAEYRWHVVIEDETTGATYDSSNDVGPWMFETPSVLDATVNVEQGEQNINPGTADLGEKTFEFSVTNNQSIEMDSAELLINNTLVETISPVPEDETVSVDLSEDVIEESLYNYNLRVKEGNAVIASSLGDFTTDVVTADWRPPEDPFDSIRYRLYHSNSDGNFSFGAGDYEYIGTTNETQATIGITDLGYNGDDCFRVTSRDLVGESDESEPPANLSAVCLGGGSP